MNTVTLITIIAITSGRAASVDNDITQNLSMPECIAIKNIFLSASVKTKYSDKVSRSAYCVVVPTEPKKDITEWPKSTFMSTEENARYR